MTQDDGYRELLRLCLHVDDPRSDLGKRHHLAEVLFLVVVALLAGAQDAEGIAEFGVFHLAWFRRFVAFEHGVPSHDTVLRLLGLVNPDAIETLSRTWTSALREPGALTVDGRHVAIDGQALRGSIDRRAGTSAVHMVSAYLTRQGITLGTVRVDDKSNEINAIPELIRSLNLRGATVTIDAMGCQRGIAATIREAGAHYVLQVKENQKKLHDDIAASMADLVRRRRPGEAPAAMERHRDTDKGHGRIETRACVLSRDLAGIERRAEWQGLSAIAAVAREREDVISGKKSRETSYFIVSDPSASAAQVSDIIRNHWAIENGLHWSLDVVWGSDGHKVRDRAAAENLARLRRFSAGLVKQATGWGMSGRRVRQACTMSPDHVLRVLAGDVIARTPKRVPNRNAAGKREYVVRATNTKP